MKASKHVLLTVACMLWLCISALSQLCPSSALAPVFKQDFGQGTTATSTTQAVSGSTNYVFGSVGTDGNYVITPAFDVSGKADWTKLGDHTGNTNGNMFLVNAGGGKSIFLKQTVTGLCSGSSFNFTAWLANANTSSTISVCGSGYKYPKVTFNIKDLNGNVLATMNTGNLPLSPVNGPANWQQYGMQFTLPSGTNSLVLEMVDALGGAAACGNDLALDDILFTACTPQVSVTLSTATAICSGTSTTISTALTNSPFTAPAYQWQKSTDNGVSWTDIGTPATTADQFPLTNVTAADNGLYRVLVGPDVASLSSNSCITASNPITITVNSRPVVSISSSSPVCSGNTITLSSTASGGVTPYSYTWSGPNGFSSLAPATSIPTAATAATGVYSLTITDANGCTITASTTVTVNATPVVAAISGISGAGGGCLGTTLTLSDVTPGGTWSSNNTSVATITSGGQVSMLSPGTSIIDYTVTSSGCSQSASKTITVASVKLQNDVIACNSGPIQFDQAPFTPYYSGSSGSDSYAWNITSTGGSVTYTGGTDASSKYPYVQLTNGTVYSVSLQYTTNGVTCAATQLIYKYIIPADTISLSHDTTICNSVVSLALSGTASVITNSFLWTTDGSGSFSNSSTLSSDYTPSAADKTAGSIKIYLTGSTNLSTTGSCPAGSSAIDSMILRIVPLNTGMSSAQTICSGQALGFSPSSSLPGSLYNWSSSVTTGVASGNASSGTGSITDLLLNPSASLTPQVTYTINPYSLLPGGGACNGTAFTYVVSISPVAAIQPVTATTCSGIAFSITPANIVNGNVPSGTSYSWNTPAVSSSISGGVSASTSSLIAGLLTNSSNTMQTATYSVTPVSGSCTGAAFTVSVVVEPVPVLNGIASITCSGVSFTITPTQILIPAGTTFSWAAPSVTGGLLGGGAATNATNISGLLNNPDNTAQTATYLIAPVAGHCAGNTFTLVVTVEAMPVIDPVTIVSCSGVAFGITPTDPANGIIPAGTVYSWAMPVVTGGLIGGMSASNASTISGRYFNPGNTAQTVTYTVFPATGSCAGSSFTVTVRVDPVAIINAITAVICSGTSFSFTPTDILNGIVPGGTVYNWSAPLVTGGITGGHAAINATNITGILTVPGNSGQTASYTVTPASGACAGSPFTVIVNIDPVAAIGAMTATSCSGISFSLTPTDAVNGRIPGATLYNWPAPAVTGGLTGLAAGVNATFIAGTLSNPGNGAQTATYTVSPITGSCIGADFTVTVSIDPVALIGQMTAIVCSGTSFSFTPTNSANGIIPAGTTYSWAMPSVTGSLTGVTAGNNATGITAVLTNATNAAQTATYFITPFSGVCVGSSFTLTVTTEAVAAIGAMSIITCSGISFAITPATGNIPAGTVYNWNAPTTTGGITGAVLGVNAGNISALLINTTNTAQTATYLVTPSSGNCPGEVFTVTVSVDPVADIHAMTGITCSGTAFAYTPSNAVNGIVPAGTTYTWSMPVIPGGLTNGGSATNATKVAGILYNSTNTAQTATYSVTPISGSCTGSPFSVTVTIDPVASADPITLTTCSGTAFSLTPVNGVIPAGTTYSFPAPAVTGGLSGGQSGANVTSISGSLINPANTMQTATYTVTPVSGTCTGIPFTVVITVDPVAVINAMTVTSCSGISFSLTPTDLLNGRVPGGTLYNWSAPVVTGGLSGGAVSGNAALINGLLANPTNIAQTGTYTISPVTGSCMGDKFTVTVTIDPVATINPMTTIVCSGISFSFTPTNNINGIVPAGTVYNWAIPSVTASLNGATAGNNAAGITATLINTANTAQTATYLIIPVSGVCTGLPFTLTVTSEAVADISAMIAITCSGVSFGISPVSGIIPVGTMYNWNMPATTGGITGAVTGVNAGSISALLVNPTNTTQTATYFVTPASGNCTGTAFTVTVSINAVAVINSITITTCGGVGFAYTPTDAINGVVPTGTVYAWSQPVVSGGLTGGMSATNATNISGTLHNSATAAQTASYSITPLSGSCTGSSFGITLTINPVAVIDQMTAIVCSGTSFSLTPSIGIIPAGTTYSFSSPAVTGGLGGGQPATNVASISGLLYNPTNTTQTATYIVTPVSGICTGASFTVTISVEPVALVNAMTTINCSGVVFSLTPTDMLNGRIPNGTLYNWSAPVVTGGLNGGVSASGVTAISGLLTDPLNTAQTATYTIIPVTGNCVSAGFTFTVTIEPVAAINPITAIICSGTSFGFTPVDTINGIVPAGTTYSWAVPSVTGSMGGISAGNNATGITSILTNPSNTAQTATYFVTPLSGACAGASFTVIVTTEAVASIDAITAVTCSGVPFSITPVNNIDGIIPAGTVYNWSAPSTTGGITGAGGAVNAGNISASLINPTNIGQTASYLVTPVSGNCTGAAFTVTVSVNPVPVISPLIITTCSGVGFGYSPANAVDGIVPAGITYTWPMPFVTGGLTGATAATNATNIVGILDNPTNSVQTASYLVTPVSGVCTGSSFTVTVTVDPVAVISPMTIITCSGAGFNITPAGSIVPAATMYSWGAPVVTGGITGGQGAINAGSISGLLSNPANTTQTATYFITNTTGVCQGSGFTVTVSVDPVATVDQLSDTTCAGIAFGFTPANGINGVIPAATIYNWGIPAMSTGLTGGQGNTNATNIGGLINNSTAAAGTVIYIVNPVAGNCTGASFTVTVAISPVANISPITATTCSGVALAITPLNGLNGVVPAGTVFNWTVPATTGGMSGAASGTNTSSFGALINNPTSVSQIATYSITPVSGTCTGAGFTITLTVDPVATINAMSSATCNGVSFSLTPTDIINGIVPAGTMFNWAAPAVTGGLQGGAGAANAVTVAGLLTNTGNTAQTATYIINPVSGMCYGGSFTMTISVYPSAAISPMTATICSGVLFTLSPVNGIIPAGTIYNWNVPVVTGGITGGLSAVSETNISGALSNPGSVSQSAVYTVIPVSGNCAGLAFSVTLQIDPVASIGALSATTCSGVTFSITPINTINGVVPAGTTYSWGAPSVTGGLQGGAGVSNAINISGVLSHTTNTSQTATYIITPATGACTGATFLGTITVNAVAAINAMSFITCSGIAFAYTPANNTDGVVPAGTEYNWSSPVVTGGISGMSAGVNTGLINGLLLNTGNTAQTATYTISSVSGSCSGNVFTVTVTVDPVAAVSSLTLVTCSGVGFASTPANIINGIVPASTLYSWSIPVTTGGLTGGAGTINMQSISGVLNNTSIVAQTATYSITPVSGHCTGNTFTLTVTISPVASINPLTTTVCSGISFALTPTNVSDGAIPAGTLYKWAAPSVSTGLQGGAGSANSVNINGSLNNTVNTSGYAVYHVIPVSGVCNGNAFSVTVTIDPVASINPISATLCSGSGFSIIPADIANGTVPAGTTYTWGLPVTTGSLSGAVIATNATTISGNISNTSYLSQTAIYSVAATSGNCSGNGFSVTVVVRPLPKAELNIVRSIDCSPFTIDQNIITAAIYTGANDNYTWFVNNAVAGSGTQLPAFVLTQNSATVKLKVTSLFNCGTDEVASVMKVYDSPSPSFSLSDSTGCAPLITNIVNTTPDISSFHYTWTSGSTVIGNNAQPGQVNWPSSILGNDTTYTITLKAYQYCDTFRVSRSVTVSRKARLDMTAILQNNCSPLNVLFTNQSSGSQVQYRMHFGDGADSSVTANSQYLHTYYTGSQISYPATLFASNNCGIDSMVLPVVVAPNRLRVDLALSDSIICSNVFAATLLNNTDSASRYSWDFGDGSAIQITNATGVIRHTYPGAGSYLITNKISGTCSDTIVYRRFKSYPAVRAAANTLTQNNCIGTAVDFKNTSDSSLSVKWLFGDGGSSDSSLTTHTYIQAGVYTTRLRVWKTYSDITCADSLERGITVVERKAGQFTMADMNGSCLPFAVSFSSQNRPVAQTIWNWGDGLQSTGDSAAHQFTSNGNYTVVVEAKQAGGCVFADTAVVKVNAPQVDLQYKGGAYCKQNNSVEFNPVTNLTDSIRWDFGDGATMITTGNQKVSHTYTRNGGFIPKLMLVNSNCHVPVVAKDSIYVDEIAAGFKLTAVNECAKTNYNFTDTSRSFFPITRRVWNLDQRQSAVAIQSNVKEINKVYTVAGDYSAGLEVQNQIGCKATLDANFNVQVYEFPKASISSINDACLYSLMEIKSVVNSQDSVIRRLWNLGNGTAATDSIIKVQYSNEGTYTVKLTVGTVNSCYDSVYKQLSVHPAPTVTLSADKTICKGDTLQLKANGALGYIWKDQDGNIVCNNCNEMKVSPQKSTQYKVVGYDEYGCSNVMTTSVRLVLPLKLGLLSSDSLCEGSTKRINASGADNYQWLPAPGLSSYTSAVTYATPAVTTTYKVIGKDAYNCFADTATIQLVIGRPTPVHVGNDTTVIAGTPVQLNTVLNSPDIRQWQWGGKGDYSCVYCKSPTVKVIDDQDLTVKAINQFGCITTDTIHIKTFCSGSEVFIPNAFSPDGDGVNDLLVIQGRGIKVIKNFRIYTRWGEMVFEKNNFLPGDKSAAWDGKIRGKQAGADVFVYLCEAVCEKGTPYTFKGNVAIIK